MENINYNNLFKNGLNKLFETNKIDNVFSVTNGAIIFDKPLTENEGTSFNILAKQLLLVNPMRLNNINQINSNIQEIFDIDFLLPEPVVKALFLDYRQNLPISMYAEQGNIYFSFISNSSFLSVNTSYKNIALLIKYIFQKDIDFINHLNGHKNNNLFENRNEYNFLLNLYQTEFDIDRFSFFNSHFKTIINTDYSIRDLNNLPIDFIIEHLNSLADTPSKTINNLRNIYLDTNLNKHKLNNNINSRLDRIEALSSLIFNEPFDEMLLRNIFLNLELNKNNNSHSARNKRKI